MTASNNSDDDPVTAYIQVKDKDGNVVANQSTDADLNGTIVIDKAQLWWPYLMHPNYGYLYTFEIKLQTEMDEIIDVYRLRVGIRTLRWTNKQFLINSQPIYFRGFGKHEDSDVSLMCQSNSIFLTIIVFIDSW